MPCLDEAGAEAGVAREAQDGDGGEAAAHLVRQGVEVVVAEVQRREAAPPPRRLVYGPKRLRKRLGSNSRSLRLRSSAVRLRRRRSARSLMIVRRMMMRPAARAFFYPVFIFIFGCFCRPAARQSPRARVGCDGGDAAAAPNAGIDARFPLLRQGGVSGGESFHTTATTSTTNTNTNKIMIINGDGGDDDYDNRTFRPLTWGGDSGACAPGTACGGRKQARLQKPCQARRRTAPSNPCDIRARIRHALQMHPGVSDFGSHASALGVRKTRRALAWSRRASMRRAGLKGCCATAGARGGEAA